MKIVADENIPYVNEAFSTLGDVVCLPGRSITPEDVRDADLLLVRSITKVGEQLLQGSTVRFVATATIGEDHIDRGWLEANHIGFSSAPGCNANSVGEYLVAALLHLSEKHGFNLSEKSIGIVGVGNVGSNVAQKASALGMKVVLNDPPREESTGSEGFSPLDAIVDCDIITTHVPLTRTGPHGTWHLVDSDFLARLKPGSFVINSARGAVVDNPALLDALRRGHLGGAVLDVWEGEPEPDLDLLRAVDLATPHIAGYSFDGKVNGTVQIYEAACAHLGKTADWSPTPLLPVPEHPSILLTKDEEILKNVVERVYPIRNDDARMRLIVDEAPSARAGYFDKLRKTYPRRREFYNSRIEPGELDAATVEMLRGIGFTVASVVESQA